MLPKSNMIFIGLDGEMTSTDVGHGQLCQIGVALNHAKWFVSDIRIASYAECNPISMAVHGIPEKYLKRSAPLRGEVDDNLYGFLQAIGGNTEKKILLAVGFNVGSFDLPFVKDALPKTYTLLSRRTVDLNAVCFAMGGQIEFGGSHPSWKGFKRMSKQWAAEFLATMHVDQHQHNAGYDALEAIYAFHFLQAVIAGARHEKDIHAPISLKPAQL